MTKITIIDHPLIKHKMTQIRQKDTKTKDLYQCVQEIGTLMA